jgi:hypothetical protein
MSVGVEHERVIYIGIDDTDTADSPGTNQLARHLAAVLPPGFTFVVALRHQLLFDPRVPYTSKNGCASLLLRADPGRQVDELLPILRGAMRSWYVRGSDPGLCVAEHVDESVTTFARRVQREIVRQAEARALASASAVHLEGFGGTEDGVIGALAGVGLLAAADDGRVVHRAGWEWPDTFAGLQDVAAVRNRGVDEVLEAASGTPIDTGMVDVGKHLRPSYRDGRVVLYVEASHAGSSHRWRALKLP